MKQIVIKFTVSKGIASFLMYWLLHHKYTHAAIGLNNETNEFYSFSLKGFSTEKKRTNIPASWRENYAYYYIDVENSDYEKLIESLDLFINDKEKYRYSNLEVFCAFLRISYKAKNGYYCSYFVADLLASSGIYTFTKTPSLYLPHYLFKEIKKQSHIEFTFGSID